MNSGRRIPFGFVIEMPKRPQTNDDLNDAWFVRMLELDDVSLNNLVETTRAKYNEKCAKVQEHYSERNKLKKNKFRRTKSFREKRESKKRLSRLKILAQEEMDCLRLRRELDKLEAFLIEKK